MSRKIVGNTVGTNLNPEKVQVEMPDMSEYVKKDDYASATKHGVVKVNNAHGLFTNSTGNLCVQRPTEAEIDAREQNFKPIVVSLLDYAVMKALTDSKNHDWTEEQKQLASSLLNVLSLSNIGSGLRIASDGNLNVVGASKAQVDNQATGSFPITPVLLSYAVKKALSDCKLEGDDVWTDEEKAKALELLGGVASSLVSHPAKNGTIVLRGATGAIFIGEPTSNSHATTKKYVDDLVGSKDIINSASGEVVTTTDSAKAKPKNIKLYGKSKQDGTPSMENKVEVESLGESGSIVGKVLTKNLWNNELASDINNWENIDSDYYSCFPIYVGKGNTVTAKYNQMLPSGLQDIFTCFTLEKSYLSEHKKWLYHATSSAYQNIAVTMTAIDDYIYLWALKEGINNGNFTKYIGDYLQIELGTEATNYESYTEQPFTALTPNGLRGIDDARDYRDYAEGKNVQHIQKYVCDSNTTITDLTRYGTFENNALFRITATGVKQQGKILCTHMRYEGFVWGDKFGCAIIEQGMIDFSIPYELLGLTSNSTADERISAVKVLLQNNPIEFYAELEEPIVTDLTQEEINQYNALVMNYPNTTIVNDAGAYMEVEYVADTKCYIDNKFKQLEIALANTNANLL